MKLQVGFKKTFFAICFFVFILTYLVFTIQWNRYSIKPSIEDKLFLNQFFHDSLRIKSEIDIIRIQNKVWSEIKSKDNNRFPVEIKHIIESKSGLCYDRSLLLQKVMILNDLSIRPVFLFVNKTKPTRYIDLLSKNNIYTHNLFEFKWQNNWYVMLTNNRMDKLMTLDMYLKKDYMPQGTLYIRHINNRNGKIIPPSFILDIY